MVLDLELYKKHVNMVSACMESEDSGSIQLSEWESTFLRSIKTNYLDIERHITWKQYKVLQSIFDRIE